MSVATGPGDLSQRKAAILAGIGLLITLVFFVLASIPSFVVPEDATQTAAKIKASPRLFRACIASWLLVFAGDVLRAWALYVFFRPVNRSLSLLSAWFMLIYVSIAAITQLTLVLASELLSGASYLAGFEPTQLDSLVLLLTNGHTQGFQLGLFFFGFHLLVLGCLVFRSGYVPRLLGFLLVAAFLAYLIDSTGRIMSPDYPKVASLVLGVPMAVGELALIGWLVFRGGRQDVPATGSAMPQ